MKINKKMHVEFSRMILCQLQLMVYLLFFFYCILNELSRTCVSVKERIMFGFKACLVSCMYKTSIHSN